MTASARAAILPFGNQGAGLHTSLNRPVFFVPLAVLAATLAASLIGGDDFLALERALRDWIVGGFGWLFAGAGLAFLVLLGVIALSPLGGGRIGGPDAQPILNRWRWFSVTLCTTIATGILFWGTAEPLFHLNAPPPALGLEPGGAAAASFAMATMFLHWTLTPYGIYTVAGLAFALVYYNLREPFSLSSLFVPLFGSRAHGRFGTGVDIVCLYALVAGMAAALGAGILALAGGIEGVGGFDGGAPLRWGLAAAIVGTFIVSAASGLHRGIARLSGLNIWLFFGLVAFVLLAGPSLAMLRLGGSGLAEYAANFVPRNLTLGLDRQWSEDWTITYWANWFAWAPVTALFLGRLAVGYTVRAFIAFNLLLPALFSAVWMTVFAGATIALDQGSGGGLNSILTGQGPDPVLYSLFARLPGGAIAAVFLIAAIFLSYVTAADSNVSAMSALSTHGISPDTPEAPLGVKIVWGVAVGLVAVVLVGGNGLDGIRMISVLGGFPALFVVIGAGVALTRLALSPPGEPPAQLGVSPGAMP